MDSPRADAEQIAAHVHGVRRGELHRVPDPAFNPRFWDEIARREAREPLQHITGHAYFRYLDLEVGPGVFVPRPETEIMTGWAIDRLREMDVTEAGRGRPGHRVRRDRAGHRPGGAQIPGARGGGWTRWPGEWVQRNIDRLRPPPPRTTRGPGRRHGEDFGSALPELDGSVDLVVSNPPYIPWGSSVPPEVGEYDPATALWGGTDGMDAVKVVEQAARRLLRPGGLVAVEHGAPQGASVYWIFAEERGWRDPRNHKDLARRDRFVTAVWPGPQQWEDGLS